MTDFIDFVKRPSVGNVGRRIKVRANYFAIKLLPEANIHHYDVTITPQVPPALNRKAFKVLEEQRSFGLIKPVYDGRKSLFSAKPLTFGNSNTFNDINVQDPPRTFSIKIKKVAEINMAQLSEFLFGRCSITNNILTGIMALDILIHHKPSMTYATAGRSFYTNKDARPLSGGLEVWQGYYQSARPTYGKMMINVDLSATAFYESGDLVNLVVKILNKRSPDDLRRPLLDKDRTKLQKMLKNLKIIVTHRGDSNKNNRWKITGVTPTSASNTRFEHEGRQTDVAAYFESKYRRRLQFPFLPCVIVKKTNSLPLEVCKVVPGQRCMRKLDDTQTSEMIKFACQRPDVRANKINQGLQILNYRQNEYMRDFGLEVTTEMEVVDARILPPPRIQYHPSSHEATFTPRDGAWSLRDKKLATSVTLGSWAVAVFGTPQDYPESVVKGFLRELIVACQDHGINVPNKNPPILHYNPQGNTENDLKQTWIKAGNTAKAKPQLIVCILPRPRVGLNLYDLYAEIKRVGDTVVGIVTQCLQGKNIHQPKKAYCTNVCLKINVKLGGMNSSIEPSLMPFITQCPTILIGADVTHPTLAEANIDRPGRPSIAALCGSMDIKASRYAASIRVQAARQEVIQDLANMVKELLKTFYQTCGRKPERILFYRDGVSEGQFSQVLESEIKAINAACKALEASYKPTITFVVVQKRHHTRFFPMNQKECDNKSGNCLPGTVVETGITHPFQFDFYLLSHPGLQGTSRPTHYHVLYDDNGFTPDALQSLSYNLCYNYARCTRAVSRVPPVYYAHLVSARARLHASGGDSSSEGSGPVVENYEPVKPDLLKIMYFM